MIEKIAIIYQPGFAGHLLAYLLSLSESTVFLKPPTIELTDTLQNRLDFYSFNNTSKYKNWISYHKDYDVSPIDLIDQRTESKIIFSMHPNEAAYERRLHEFTKILIVDLAFIDFCNFWVIETKKNWQDCLCVIKEDIDIENIIKNNYLPIIIHLEKFLDPSTWFDEYSRLSELLQLPILPTAATELYNSWYRVRVLPYIEKFKTLSEEQKKFYHTARIKLENSEIVIIDNVTLGQNIKGCTEQDFSSQLTLNKTFVKIYNTIRGDDWPDCDNLSDFYKLPNWVHLEINRDYQDFGSYIKHINIFFKHENKK